MSIRRSSIVLAVLGIALIAGAAVFKFVITPGLSQLPPNFSQTVAVEGSVVTVNPQAFQSGDFANLFTPSAPVTAQRTLTVEATEGDVAIVSDTVVANLPDGVVQNDTHTYAIDRKTLEPAVLTAQQVESLVPADRRATFEPHDGYAFGFPMDPPRYDVEVYDAVLREAVPAVFVGQKTLDGRKVYDMTVSATGPVRNPATLAGFGTVPQTLPKIAIAGLLVSGNVPEASRSAVSSGLSALPEAVPVSIGATNRSVLSVDKQFGAPIAASQELTFNLTIDIDGEEFPILPLSTMDTSTLDSDTSIAAAEMSDQGAKLRLVDTWGPLAVAIVGLVLLGIATARRRAPDSTTSGEIRDSVDA